MAKKIFGLLLALAGGAIIWSQGGWQLFLGVFLWTWGNNLQIGANILDQIRKLKL